MVKGADFQPTHYIDIAAHLDEKLRAIHLHYSQKPRRYMLAARDLASRRGEEATGGPDARMEAFREAGADWISVHPESGPHLNRTLKRIRQLGAKAGVVFNPSTSPSVIEWMMDEIDLILVMSINPGFGGQSFMDSQLAKIERLRKMIDAGGYDIVLEVDGGVSIYLSAKAGEGVELLRAELLRVAGWHRHGEDVILARERHLIALREAQARVHAALEARQALELMAEELRLAQEAVNEITGEFTPDDLLGVIFSRFCIGK